MGKNVCVYMQSYVTIQFGTDIIAKKVSSLQQFLLTF